jgi:hypothetical protein|tara:strand:+ start:1699 stop:2580 length:882 start_codon:yes stop_codon:yes gene_type:complete
MFDIQILLILFIILILVFILILILYKFKKDNNIHFDKFIDIKNVSDDEQSSEKLDIQKYKKEIEKIYIKGNDGPKGDNGLNGIDGKKCVPCNEPDKPEPLPLIKFIKQKKNENDPEVILGQYPQKELYPSPEFIIQNKLKEIVIQIPNGETGPKGDTVIGPNGPKGLKGETLECSNVCETGSIGPLGPEGPQGDPGRGIDKIELTDDYKLKIKYTDNSIQIINKSLKGEKGISGLNGINGKDGNNGIKGETWVPSYQNGKIKFSLNNNYIISDDLRSKCTTNGSSLKWMQQCP